MDDEKTKKIEDVSADIWGELDSREVSVKLMLDKGVLKVIKLKTGENLIGRMPENDIMIDDPEVSRSHARILLSREGKLTIEDMQSENGIFVNGNKVSKLSLKVGDVIGVGNHELSVNISDAFSRTTELGDQIARAQSQEWRLDQTIAAPTLEMQKELLKNIGGKKEASPDRYGTMEVRDEQEQERIRQRIKSIDTKKTPPKTLSLKFGFAGKEFSHDLSFDFVRKVDEQKEKNLEDAIYINIKVGDLIMGKKIKIV